MCVHVHLWNARLVLMLGRLSNPPVPPPRTQHRQEDSQGSEGPANHQEGGADLRIRTTTDQGCFRLPPHCRAHRIPLPTLSTVLTLAPARGRPGGALEEGQQEEVISSSSSPGATAALEAEAAAGTDQDQTHSKEDKFNEK